MGVLARAADAVGASLHLSEAANAADGAWPAWLSPRHQQHNAAMATAMLESLAARGHLSARDSTKWAAARDAAVWPARFEVLCPRPLPPTQQLVVDVAHNEPAIEALLASVDAAWPGAPRVVIFGANFDKDVRKIVHLLCAQPGLRRAIAVRSRHPKAVPTAQIVAECGGGGGGGDGSGSDTTAAWSEAPSMLDALGLAARTLRDEERGIVLCCGSVFVAADMRAALAADQPELFQPDDWAFDEANEPALLM